MTAGKAAAPGPVAEILGIPSGRRALRRTETRGDNGQPASITVSWYPPAIADRAPRLADSQPLPAGTLAYIAEATGTRAARADEDSRRRTRRRRHRRRARHHPRLTGPAHPHPALRRRRQAHRVRRNHHPHRAPAQPHLHHHRQLTPGSKRGAAGHSQGAPFILFPAGCQCPRSCARHSAHPGSYGSGSSSPTHASGNGLVASTAARSHASGHEKFR